jgi:hypothetical protein
MRKSAVLPAAADIGLGVCGRVAKCLCLVIKKNELRLLALLVAQTLGALKRFVARAFLLHARQRFCPIATKTVRGQAHAFPRVDSVRFVQMCLFLQKATCCFYFFK